MKLSVNEIEQLFNKIFLYLQAKDIQSIAFEAKADYYPKVWRDKTNFNDPQFIKCPDYAIGSLDDDINGLRDILSGKHEPNSIDLDRTGAILTTAGALLDENGCFIIDQKYELEISLSELKIIFETLIDFLKSWGVNEVSFNGTKDCYFKVDHKDINFYDEKFVDCPPFTIGSLTENIIDLKKVLAGEIAMNGAMMQKLGAVLVATGEDMLLQAPQ